MQVFTTKEAAKVLKVDIKTIYKLRDEKKLQCVNVGSKILISEQSINEFLGIVPTKTKRELELEEENKELKLKLKNYESVIGKFKNLALQV